MSPRLPPARFFTQRDANERPIIQALRARGFHVTQVNGKGVPDLLVSRHGAMWLVEVKQPKGRYKPAQQAFREAWQGPPLITLRSVDEALKFPEQEIR